MKILTLLCAALLTLTSCKTATPPAKDTPPAKVEAAAPPVWASLAEKTEFTPIIFAEKRPFLLVESALFTFEWSQRQDLKDLKFPPCFEDEEVECAKVFPADEATVAKLGAPPSVETIRLVTTKGLCKPALGPLTWINTTECEPSVALVYPLLSCDGPVAPVALRNHPDTPAMTWVPAVDGPIEPYAAGTQLADAGHDKAIKAWWKANVKEEAGIELEARTLLQSADSGREKIKAHRAAAHLHRPECHDEIWEIDAVGLETDTGWTPLPDVRDIAGVIAIDGFAAAIVCDDTLDMRVHTRTASGFESSAELPYYRDHEECYSTGKIGYEADCAP